MWKDFFYFTRSQKRGIIVLLFLLFCLIISRVSLSLCVSKEELSSEQRCFIERVKYIDDSLSNIKKIDTLFVFDPNLISEDNMMKLGLSSLQRKALIGYRNKIGRIDNVSELYKVYGFDSLAINRIKDYVLIPEEKSKSKKNISFTKNHSLKDSTIILEINSADSVDFKKLAGIGDVLSKRIVKYRELLGGFYSVSQLAEVYGLTNSVIDRIKDQLMVKKELIHKIDLKNSSWYEISRHPYISKEQARIICKVYKDKGIIEQNDLSLKGRKISNEEWDKMKFYLIDDK